MKKLKVERTMTHCLGNVLPCVFLALCSAPAWAAENEVSGPPPAPPGYESEKALLADFMAGKITPVNFAAELPETVVERKGIEYGKVGERSLELDLYSPKDLDHPVPAIICIHGGAWEGGSREQYKFYPIRFTKKGYVAATISYRLVGEAPYPAAVNDAKCAVRWMRANAESLHVDPDRIGVLGGSAGGHLAMMVGYSSDVPELEGDGGHEGTSSAAQAVVNFYGPTDLTTDFAQAQGAVHKFLGGKEYGEAPDLYKKASPLFHLDKSDPPTLTFHGTIDSVVPIDQADSLDEKLKELGVCHVYDRVEGWGHAMDIAQAINDRCSYLMDRFLAEHLPLP